MLAVFFGLEKLLGALRQILINRQFGRSPELDAFNAANNLPDLIFALIPVLSQYLETRGRPAAWALFSRVANLVFLVAAAFASSLPSSPSRLWVGGPTFHQALALLGRRWSPAIDWKDPGVREVLTVLGHRVLIVFFIQMVFLAQDNLASRMVLGAVTALVNGWLIMQLPQTLIGTAIGRALLRIPKMQAETESTDIGP
jgi:peptidoglycan biosynthesis protein MviN/MurJ (putative lipid II flippase)